MPGRKYDDATIATALDRRAQGQGIERIANELGMSRGAVEYHCLAAGVVPDGTKTIQTPTRSRVVQRGNHKVRLFSKAEDAMATALRLKGATITEIARALKRKPNSVRSRLQTLARHDELREVA